MSRAAKRIAAGVGPQVAGDQVEGGRLARAVRARRAPSPILPAPRTSSPPTAVTPPKRFVSPSISSSAVTRACASSRIDGPGRCVRRRSRSRSSGRSRKRRQDPAGQEQQHDHEHGRVAHQVELARPELRSDVLLRRHEHERADRRAPERPATAEERHQHRADHHQRVDGGLGVDEREVVRPDRRRPSR